MRGRKTQSAAYTLIDPSSLPEDIRQEIIDDAQAGGRNYGVRVVEEAVVGGARAPLYGVYKDVKDREGKVLSDDETRWKEAKKELGISSTKVDDDEVAPFQGSSDPRREAALRLQAQQQAQAEADRIRSQEDAELDEVVGKSDSQSHATNIVDDTLDPDATNEVEDQENEDEEEEEQSASASKKKRGNRVPK